jgi:8-oxo-dGTP pyrophosphatase MutT (NUDIX family)
MSPRILHLRRPATLSVQEGVFVPQGERGILNEVDRRWNALCAANPAYFDGRLFHVLGIHRNGHGGAVLHVMDCAYRFFAVQDEQFDLGLRALGVNGITRFGDRVLLGRRSQHVAFYRNLWEFAPGGSVCPGDNPPRLIREELLEETGLHAVQEPVANAIIFDPVVRCWEYVFELQVESDQVSPRTGEYSDLQWRRADDLPDELSPIASQMASLLKR